MSILQMSIQAGVLIVVIVVIRAIALNKLPKNAFLVLWGVALVRLLVPFSFSSRFSIYTLVNDALGRTTTSMTPTPGTPLSPVNPAIGGAEVLGTPAQAIGQQAISIDPVMLVWIIGMVAAFIFFAVVYWRNCRELRFALIIRENGFIDEWRKGHKLLRPFAILQSDRLTTPITVGFLRPRIILPKAMDMKDVQLLRYVLTHEYYHIRRFDAVWKLLVVFALCVHWFNPFVWVMAILINRDLEITCDEMVVRHFGADTKRAYAYSLISMAEQRNKLAPLFSGFSKNAAEERITAIMKIKKTSFTGIILALILVLGATTVFATSAHSQEAPAPTSIDNAITKTDDERGITLYSLDDGHTWLTLEQLERYFNEQESGEATGVLSYLNEETGVTSYSLDGGQTWLSETEYESLYPSGMPNVEWYTYEEYEAFIAEQKAALQEQIGSKLWNASDGWYTLTQEMADSIIAGHEETLEEIKNGLMVSKSIEGQPNSIMSYNPEDIRQGAQSVHEYSIIITLDNGDEVSFGPYATKAEMLENVKPFCEEQVQAGNMSQQEADDIIQKYQ